jgi:hypothetical protein
VTFQPVTKNTIIKEYFRLLDIVYDAEEEREYKWYEDGAEQSESFTLLDVGHAQHLRDEYHERAEAVLRALEKLEPSSEPVPVIAHL